jgi:hypothetical protein
MSPIPITIIKRGSACLDAHGWLMLFMALTSLLGIMLLSASIFDVPLLLGLAISTCVVVNVAAGVRLSENWRRWSWSFFLILVLGACLRAEIYPHMMGGQDQGLYTNYSEVMLREGGLNFVDAFRNELPESLRVTYDDTKMASVPLIDANKSLMTIAFYPLHPMWMAVFGWLFGLKFKTLSLMLFSLIYVWTGKLLAEEIYQSTRAGLLSAFLLATNPVLVFFSKYPVTEMVGLAFSMNAFLFLIRAVNIQEIKQKVVWLGLSVLCFMAFFFVRLQFLMYLPFFFLLIVGSLINDWRLALRSGILPATLTSCVLFALSLVWYYQFQPNLVTTLFEGHIFHLLSFKCIVLALVVCVGAAMGSFLLMQRYFSVDVLQKGVAWVALRGGWWFLLALLASLVSLMRLYQTGAMPPFSWVLDVHDPWLFRYHALYRLSLFLSPVGLLVLVFGLLVKRENVKLRGLLMLFLSTSWLVVLFQPWIPYLYYYGRYLAGDVLPYSLIALGGGVAGWSDHGRRKFAWLVFILIAAYQLFFSFAQFRFVESDIEQTFEGFAAHVRDNDIVLAIGMDDRLLVPLRISHGISIFSHRLQNQSEHLDNRVLLKLQGLARKRGGRLLIVSALEYPVRIGELLGGASFKNSFFSNGEHIREGRMQWINNFQPLLLPVRRIQRDSIWLFYNATSVNLDNLDYADFCDVPLNFYSGGNFPLSTFSVSGFSQPEEHGRWTVGNQAEIRCRMKEGQRPEMIRINALAFVPVDTSQRVTISVNGGKGHEFIFEGPQVYSDLLIPVDAWNEDKLDILISLKDARSPADVGLSVDSRKLGLNVKQVSFK